MLVLRFLFGHIFRGEIYSKWKTVDIYELLIVQLLHFDTNLHKNAKKMEWETNKNQ